MIKRKHINIILLIISALLTNYINAQEKDSILKPNEIYKPLNLEPEEKVDRALGLKYYNAGDYDKAAIIFKELANESKTNYDYKYFLFSLVRLSKFDEAYEAIKKYTNNERVENVDKGYVLSAEGKRDKAERLFNKVLKSINSRNNIMNSTRAVASSFRSVGEYEYAIKAYQEGRKQSKNPNAFANDLGAIYYSLHNYTNMIDEYLKSAQFLKGQYNYVIGRFQYYMSNDKGGDFTETLKEELLTRAQNEKDGTFFNEMARWFFIQQKQFGLAYMQTVAIDKRNNMGGELVIELANISMENKDYNTAEKSFQYILKEYKDTPLEMTGEFGILNVKYRQFITQKEKTEKQAQEIDEMFEKLLEKTGKTYQMADILVAQANLKAFYLKETETAISILEELIETPNIRPRSLAEIKLALADIYLLAGDQWEATLLYSQVEKEMKDELVGQEAKFRNAKLFYYIGEYRWTTAKLDILKTSTSSLIANDAMRLSFFIKENLEENSVSLPLQYFSKAELSYFRKNLNDTFLYLDSALNVNAWSNIEDEVLYKKAEIYMELEDYVIADSLFQKIINDYPNELLVDEALYYSAYINENYLNNIEVAKENYKELFTNYQGSVFSVIARNRFRALRGESLDYNIIDNKELIAPVLP